MRTLALLGCAALLSGCAAGLQLQEHALAGRVWDVRRGQFLPPDEMLARIAGARHVILGETHDNPEHHRLQRIALEALAQRGPARSLAMEQFDSEHQPALDTARKRGADAEALADAGQFDRKGWNWPLYRPLVAFAAAHGWRLVAANLSRSEARAIVADPSRSGLPPPDAATRAALERDLIEGHCGHRPEARRLAGLVEAQRARDARMARQLGALAPGATVLVTGVGHARKDVAVPRYMADSDVASIGFVEVDAERRAPREYLDGFATPASFDYLWFTPRQARADPCAGAAGGLKGKVN